LATQSLRPYKSYRESVLHSPRIVSSPSTFSHCGVSFPRIPSSVLAMIAVGIAFVWSYFSVSTVEEEERVREVEAEAPKRKTKGHKGVKKH